MYQCDVFRRILIKQALGLRSEGFLTQLIFIMNLCKDCESYHPLKAAEGLEGWGECWLVLPFWVNDMVEMNQVKGDICYCLAFKPRQKAIDPSKLKLRK
jgi:hypothetical protein